MGGSSGGGGGGSGAVDYPQYMKDQHTTWLTDVASDITTAQAAAPYATATAYDPDCALAASNYILSVMYNFITAVDYGRGWNDYYEIYKDKFDKLDLVFLDPYSFLGIDFTERSLTSLIGHTFETTFDDAHVSDLVNAYQADLESRRDTDFKPAYKVGMQNVNAVMSSAFTIGDALITSQVSRDVAKFSGEAYFKNEDKLLQYDQAQAQNKNQHNTLLAQQDDTAIKQEIAKRQHEFNYEQLQAKEHMTHNQFLVNQDQLNIEQERMANELAYHNAKGVTDLWDSGVKNYGNLAAMTIDSNRIKIVAKQEETDKNLEYDKKDALWDLETYKYGGNLLGSISGTAVAQEQDVSTGRSVLGGALSGAAMGTQVGGAGWGTAIGAIAGGLGGLL